MRTILILVSASGRKLKKYEQYGKLGHLNTPDTGYSITNVIKHDFVYGVDNSCYSNFDPEKYIQLLEKINRQDKTKEKLLWVTVPDVVADADATFKRFEKWKYIKDDYDIPIALVLQDGMRKQDINYSLIDAVFVGGTTEWKYDETLQGICKFAKKKNLWVHMGRVNSVSRTRYAYMLGCDSIDGTGFSMYSDKHLKPRLKYIKELENKYPERR